MRSYARPGNVRELDNEIERALREAKVNKTQAAERLGMSREGLRKKLKRLGME